MARHINPKGPPKFRKPVRLSWGMAGLLLMFSMMSLQSNKAVSADEKSAAESATTFEFNAELDWLNVSTPLTLNGLRGKVVIFDFWTYGCINCVHVLPDLAKLDEKYGNSLAVIGVHTPKFENEKNLDTLREVVIRYDIKHPVVNDVDWEIGDRFGMRAWPTQVVIDPKGEVLGSVMGEGNYDVLDAAVGRLLKEHESLINEDPLPIALEAERMQDSYLAAPGKIAVSDRYVAISDTLHHRIIVADHEGNVQVLVGDSIAGSNDGDLKTARFRSPQGLAFSDDELYVADTGNHAIRHIDLKKRRVMTIAGNGGSSLPGAGKFGAHEVKLRSPWGLAVRKPWLYIAMAGTHQIWRLNMKTGKLANFAGSGREGIVDGDLDGARFSQPSGLSILGEWLYVADAEDSAVRRIHLKRKRVDTLVGTGLFDFGDRDGPFWDALLQHGQGVAALDQTRVLVADTYNHKIKILDLKSREVTTLVGTGKPGDKIGRDVETELNEPGGLALLGDKVLIADTNNHRIVGYDLKTHTARHWDLTP